MDEGPGRPEAGTFLLDVAPDFDQVRTVRLFAAAVARHYGVDEDRVEDVKVAISEAATNSIKAHRDAGTPAPIRVSAVTQDDRLRFSVTDSGRGFSARVVPPGRDATSPAGLLEGSLGLALIRALFPDARIDPNASIGMTVSFVLETPRKDDGG